ncbi:MAG: M14 family metallopeptidase [Bacteroidota bacterium]
MKKPWKILMFAFLSLLAVLIVVMVYISQGFGKLRFDDDFSSAQDYSGYFPQNYDDAKRRFAGIVNQAVRQFKGVSVYGIAVPSVFDDALTVDVCYIPAQKDSANLLILSSGVHGVEGYVGHAVQEFFADQYLNDDLLEHTGILFIHTVNPYGFKYSRRVTENNVDMNRNSAVNNQLYTIKNQSYPEVYDLINPAKVVNTRSVENRFFFIKAMNEIRKASLPVLRQAVLQGQYDYPNGLYFGGNQHEPQIDSLKVLLQQTLKPYDRIKVIDLHTGYGERGKLHLFPNPMEGEQKQKMEQLYEGFVIDWGDSDDFYTVTGDFAGFIGDLNPGKEFYPMVFEYGTLNSQTTMGSLKSIHVMILENQGHHHGFLTEEDSLKVKSDFLEMYFPSSVSWRNYIMLQTREVFDVMLERFRRG